MIAPQGEKLLWKYEETCNFGFFPWSKLPIKCDILAVETEELISLLCFLISVFRNLFYDPSLLGFSNCTRLLEYKNKNPITQSYLATREILLIWPKPDLPDYTWSPHPRGLSDPPRPLHTLYWCHLCSWYTPKTQVLVKYTCTCSSKKYHSVICIYVVSV